MAVRKRIIQSVRFSEDGAEITYQDRDGESAAVYFTHALGLGRDLHGQVIGHLEDEAAAILSGVLGEVSITPVPRNFFVRPALTPREVEILAELAGGEKLPTIAKRLFISTSTLKSHTLSLHRKFGVHNRTQLVLAAIRSGYVPL